MSTLLVALTGNPNTGKSTIFNELTGAHQKIGNWPGVTVDKKIGYAKHDGYDISIVDLPGTYSINARSPEEAVVMNYLTANQVDVVVNVVDSTNLERNLFLTLQLLEEGIPLLVVLNMQDEAKRRGVHVDAKLMEEALGMPIVEASGRNRKSARNLLNIFTSIDMSGYRPSELLTKHIAEIKEIRQNGMEEAAIEEAVISARYALIDSLVEKIVTTKHIGQSRSEKIDRYLANGIFAPIIFLAILYLVFQLTFTWIGQPVADALKEFVTGPFTESAKSFLTSAGVSSWMQSLLMDGIIGGVGAVLVFVPLIFILFFCLSFLDGTGYMARVAFIMDPLMRRLGLTGKGIMPLIMGFGCAVPAIMGARALDSEKDRMISILVTPFLTCGAKLPIMALFAAMFFPAHAANLIFAMYILGFLMAIVAAKALGATVFKDKGSTFLLELPPYRMPDMKSVFLETWDKGKGYLVKAGTVIFACAVLIWFLSNYNMSGPTEEMRESFLASVGSVVGSLFVFHGFGTWQAGAALTSGIFAKESVISTLGVLYGVSETVMEDAAGHSGAFMMSGLGTAFTALSAFSFMVFSQFYTPCVTALWTIKKETGKWKWMFFSAAYMFAVAWTLSLLVYQLGKVFGFE